MIAGQWTEVCVALPVLFALDAGYEGYVVTEAWGGASREAHDMAVERMVRAGAHPITTGTTCPNCSATGHVQQPPSRSPNCSHSGFSMVCTSRLRHADAVNGQTVLERKVLEMHRPRRSAVSVNCQRQISRKKTSGPRRRDSGLAHPFRVARDSGIVLPAA